LPKNPKDLILSASPGQPHQNDIRALPSGDECASRLYFDADSSIGSMFDAVALA
jgi:hypothetical protein